MEDSIKDINHDLHSYSLDSYTYNSVNILDKIQEDIKKLYQDVLNGMNSNNTFYIFGKKIEFNQVYTEQDKKNQDMEKISLTDTLIKHHINQMINSITKGEQCVKDHEEDCECTFYQEHNNALYILLVDKKKGNIPITHLLPKNKEDKCFPFNHLTTEEQNRVLREEFNIPEGRNVMVPPCRECHMIDKDE
jgi:hypothetical protein